MNINTNRNHTLYSALSALVSAVGTVGTQNTRALLRDTTRDIARKTDDLYIRAQQCGCVYKYNRCDDNACDKHNTRAIVNAIMRKDVTRVS